MCLTECRVLVVDDESLIAFQIADIVKAMGAVDVTLCKSTAAILTLREAEGSFQLAIVDIRNAHAVCAGVLQEISRQRVPVVLTTTDDEIDTDLLTNKSLLQIVVKKPFGSQDISNAIEEIVSQSDGRNIGQNAKLERSLPMTHTSNRICQSRA